MKYIALLLIMMIALSGVAFAGNFGEIDINNIYVGVDQNYYKYPFDLNAVSDGTPDVNEDTLCWWISDEESTITAATWHTDTNTCSALSIDLAYLDDEGYYMIVSNGQGDINYNTDTITVWLDQNAPGVSEVVINNGSTTNINLTAVDVANNTGRSDVNGYWYSLDDATWYWSAGAINNLAYSSPTQEIGLHTLTYYVLDNLDNNTGFLTIDFNIDGSAPVFTGPITATREYIGTDYNYYDFNVMWISGVVSDTDEDLNILSWQYSVNDGFTWSQLIPDSNFAYPDTNRIYVDLNYEWGNTGQVQIKFRISDLNGNTTESDDMNWYLDNTAPTTVATFDGIDTITLTATDAATLTGVGVGVKGYYYSVDGEAWVYVAASSGTITVSTPGDHHIYFYSTDNFDNNEMRDNLSGVPWDKPFITSGISPTGGACTLIPLLFLVLVGAFLVLILGLIVTDNFTIELLVPIVVSALTFIIILYIGAYIGGAMCTV